MTIFEIILLGIALSMDAAAVSMTNGLVEPKMKVKKVLLIATFFGLFQGFMPLIGYYAGSIFSNFVSTIAPYLALVLLGFIGGKMIYEAVKKNKDEEDVKNLTIKNLFVQAIATSIDALAVGISFIALDASNTLPLNIFQCCAIIVAATFIISFIAVFIGKKFGDIFNNKAQLIGGLILVGIGIKIFIDGVFLK